MSKTRTTNKARARKPAPTTTAGDAVNRSMSEAQLQAAIIERAKRAGYLTHHDWDSRFGGNNDAGCPDLWMLHPQAGKLIVAELKTERGKLTDQQMRWINGLEAAGIEVHVWRPSHWRRGVVEAVLLTPLAIRGLGLGSKAVSA